MSIFTDIRIRLDSVRRLLLKIEFRSDLLLGVGLVTGMATVLILAENLFHFTSQIRTALFWISVVLIGGSGLWLVVRPLLRLVGLMPAPSEFQLARIVGATFPEIRDRLLNLLQLQEERNRGTLYSPELIDASFQDLAKTIAPVDFADAVDPSPTRRAAKAATVSCASLLLLFAATPGSSADAAYRLFRFDRDFVPRAQYFLEIHPGNAEVVKGESLDLTVRVIHAAPGRIAARPMTLFWKPEGRNDFESRQLKSDSTALFRTTLPALRSSVEYFAEFAGIESDRFRITVVDRPVMQAFHLRLDYPSYTGLPARIQDDFVGDATAVAGTIIRIEGTASKELHAGFIRFDRTFELPLDVRGSKFTGQFTLAADSQYQVILTDGKGLTNPDPILYTLRVIPDEYPQISLLQPGKNIDIAGTSSLPMVIQVSDDFGFSSLRLGYRLVHSRYEQPSESSSFLEIPLPRSITPQAEISFEWDFSPLRLVPEDIVEYAVEVFDNDAFAGPKSTRTDLFLLRLPSLEEVFTDLDESHEETLQDLKETVQEAKDLKEKIESINEDFKKNKEIDWQQQKHMQETARKFQDLQKKLDDVQNRLENMTEQMQEQNVLSTETLEKYLELQQLFEQLNSDELQQALKKMQQAIQTVNKEQLRRALEQITFSEERFRQSIERTLDLLKRIQIEQKLDEARKRAEELNELQKELDNLTESAPPDSGASEELSRKQKDLLKKLEALKESAKDVQNRMEEFFTEMPEEELKAALERLDSMKTSESMEKAAGELQASQLRQARQTQRQVQRGLQQFSQELSRIQMQMLQQQQQHIVNELRRATQNLLELSQREEQLKQQSANAPSNSSQLRQNAQDQMRALQDLNNIISSLQELSKRSFAITPGMGRALGEAMVRMRNALKALDTRSGGVATQEQRHAMESLNRATMEVQQSLQNMMQQGGGAGGGLMSQLQQMAGQQMSINMRTQGMENAVRLAAEQQALQKSLEQLNAEARAAGDQERILGDLERIAEEMKEVVRNLEQGDVNPETIRRQERILSRLLDASRSTRERDFEKKRRAETGKQITRPGPDALDPTTLEGRNKLRDDLLKALEHGYSKDYQELIRRYFEQLQKVERR